MQIKRDTGDNILIVGNYVLEDAETVEDSKHLVYGFIRKVDYHRETVRYALTNIKWFSALVRHTVVSVGRGLFGASDQVLGRIIHNNDTDIIVEALHNVAEQPDFEQELNYFTDKSDYNKAMESYIGRMIAYTATEWVRTKVKEFEQNISFESVLEDKGDRVFANIVRELGLDDTEARQIIEDFNDATVDEYTEAGSSSDNDDEEEPDTEVLCKEALAKCFFVDEHGVYRDCRLCVMVGMFVFGVTQNFIQVKRGSFCDSIMEMYRHSSLYALASEKEEDNKGVFLSAMRFGASVAEACGYGICDEESMLDKLFEVFKISSMKSLAKYSADFLESGKEFLFGGY